MLIGKVVAPDWPDCAAVSWPGHPYDEDEVGTIALRHTWVVGAVIAKYEPICEISTPGDLMRIESPVTGRVVWRKPPGLKRVRKGETFMLIQPAGVRVASPVRRAPVVRGRGRGGDITAPTAPVARSGPTARWHHVTSTKAKTMRWFPGVLAWFEDEAQTRGVTHGVLLAALGSAYLALSKEERDELLKGVSE